MKKKIALTLVLLTLLSLFSCTAGGKDDGTTTVVTEDSRADTKEGTTDATTVEDTSLTLIADGKSEYTIVRPEGAKDSYETAAAIAFNEKLKAFTGKTLPVTTDWKDNEVKDKEVLIGITSRDKDVAKVDRSMLGYGGYIVAVIGERIVLTANDKAGLDAAVEYFFSFYDDQKSTTTIKVNKELYNIVEKAEINAGSLPFRAMWLSQFDLNSVYGSSGGQANEATFRNNITRVLDNCKSIGINNVIVQVRPNADSMYPSEYYAPSAYVVGEYGKDFTYDPFAIIVKEAHDRGLLVHAWINPMRAMKTTEIVKLDQKYTVRKWWDDESLREKYLPTVNSQVYLNVGYPEVRQLILDGAAEILAKYSVDGLHMDDYFYPTKETSFDAAAYKEYGSGKSLADWRRANINTLVEGLYSISKADGKNVVFGISPAGNIDNVYNSQYADIYTWCANKGYIDYICPQIYFGFEHKTCAFDKTADKWSGIIKTDGVCLIIGMTLGKAVNGAQNKPDTYAGDGANEWINNKDVLLRCLVRSTETDKCTGVAYFCYQYFWNPTTGAENSYTKAERDNLLPCLAEIAKADEGKNN